MGSGEHTVKMQL